MRRSNCCVKPNHSMPSAVRDYGDIAEAFSHPALPSIPPAKLHINHKLFEHLRRAHERGWLF